MIAFIVKELQIIMHFVHVNHEMLTLFIPLFIIILLGTAHFDIIPNKIQSLFEIIYEFLESQMRVLFHSEKDYSTWMPFFLSLFFYVLLNNIVGLIPGLHPLTSNIYITGSLSVMVITLSIIVGIKRKGPINFIVELTPTGVAWPIRVLLFPIEIVSLLSKAFSLGVRLYANMFAGHMILVVLLSLTEIFKSFFIVPLDVVVVTIMLFFELLVSFIQAFIFAYLSAIYVTDTMYKGH